MKLSKFGEFGLIERFKKSIPLDSSVIKGTGDDCAVIEYSKDKYQLFTCDMIIEGVDFLPKEDPYFIGRKAVAISVSDIAACAGIPRHCVVSLGLPTNKKVEFVDRLLKGMLSVAREFKINLVGGDLSRSDRLVIDVSMLGLVEKKKVILRSGAKAGDKIFVTGSLGGSIHSKHLKFTPRVKESRYLADNFKINSMIDISDGFVQDLRHILYQSKVGAVIYEKMIPLSPKAENLNDALYSGEDFELIFTLSAGEAKRLILSGNKSFRMVGEVCNKKYGLVWVDKRGKRKNLAGKGFKHF